MSAQRDPILDASLFAGLAHAGVGSFSDAATHFEDAARFRPNDPAIKGALARVLLLLNREDDAEVLMRDLEAMARTDPMAALHLADTYLQAGRSEDAFHLMAAARRSFDLPLIDARLAETAIRTRRIADALAAAKRAEARLGDHPSAINVAGPVALLAGDGPATTRIVAAVERLPAARAAAVFDHWAGMLMAGDHRGAALIAAELAAAREGTSQRWRLISDLRRAERDLVGSEEAALAALRLSPDDAEAMTQLARCRMSSGDIAGAKEILLKAVAADPACAVAFDYLTQIDPEAMTARMAAYLETLLARAALPTDARPKALLALARRNEIEGDPSKALAQILEGKEIIAKAARASGGGYRPDIADAAVTRLKNVFARALHAGVAPSSPRLIFIVGMPRSGTSLVEQILSAHSSVYGAGELPEMINIANELWRSADSGGDIERLLQAGAGAWRARYLAALPKEAHEAAVVTDKHPLNFWSVGAIRTLFPDAKIVSLNRAPVDVCLSILRFRFFADYTFANEIDAVAHYYAAYMRVMTHWRSVFGDAIYDVEYETLVEAPEREVRALLQSCDLPWEDVCLDFHKSKRTVITHSAAQVREPINTRAIERRKRYGDSLKPLEDALARYGVPTA